MLAALLVLPAEARADDTEPIRVELVTPAGCPDAAAFAGEIRARTARARLADGTEDARTFAVRIEPSAKGSRGKLTIRSLDGQSSIREVSGKTCAEVTSALALISALTIDPRASTAATLPPVPPTPTGPPAPPGPTALSGATPRGATLASMPGDPSPPLAHPLPIVPDEPPSRPWHFVIGAEVVAYAAIAPGLTQGITIFGEASSAALGPWSPALRLTLQRAGSRNIETLAGNASIRFTALRGDFCPLRLGEEAEAGLRFCGTGEAGILEGYGTVHEYRPWLSIGGLARLQWVMLGFLELDFSAGLNLPLIRGNFFFDTSTASNADDTPIHEVPFAGGLLGVGVGVRFP